VASVVDRGLLAALFVPFLAGLGILLGTLGYGAGRHLLIIAQRRSKPCSLGMLGGGSTTFSSGALGGTDRRVDGSQWCPVMRVTSGRPC
jgi:hypothetical protein